MLKLKKITSTIFPELKGIPESECQRILSKWNDGKLLCQGSHSRTGMKAQYYCLKCGSHGEIKNNELVCLECGNKNSRRLYSEAYSNPTKEKIRYIHKVDEFVLIRDFEVIIVESIEKGQILRQRESTRFVLQDDDFAMFHTRNRFAEEKDKIWFRSKQTGFNENFTTLIENDTVYDNKSIQKIKNHLSGSSKIIYDTLSCKSVPNEKAEQIELPEFTDIDYSKFDMLAWWKAISRTEVINEHERITKMKTWCANCGKYLETIKTETSSFNESRECCACGRTDFLHLPNYYSVDAKELDDGSVMLRVASVERIKDLSGTLIDGVDPQIDEHINEVYVNHIFVSNTGKIKLYDDRGFEIQSLRIPKWESIKENENFFTDEAKIIIENSKAISKTGFNQLCFQSTTLKYFEYLISIPALEIFAKMKMQSLVYDILEKDLSDIPQYLKKTGKDSRMAHLNKAQIKSLQSSTVSLKHLIMYMQCLNKDPDVLFETFVQLISYGNQRLVLDILRQDIPGINVAKIQEYLLRVDESQCCPIGESMQLWCDYLRMIKELECDMTDSKLVYPNSLKREHDKAARKVEQINNQYLVEDFEKRAEENMWLEYKGKSLSVIVPKHLPELYEEGRMLNHCVGTYAKIVSKGQTTIAFIRKNSRPNVPFCTAEVHDKSIVQLRGFSNRDGRQLSGVETFINEWSKEKDLEIAVA